MTRDLLDRAIERTILLLCAILDALDSWNRRRHARQALNAFLAKKRDRRP